MLTPKTLTIKLHTVGFDYDKKENRDKLQRAILLALAELEHENYGAPVYTEVVYTY